VTTTAGPTDDGQLLRSFSPQAPADLVGEFRISSGSEVERAVRAAHAAQREWWALGAAGRAAALAAAATRLSAEREKATALVVREVGKPVSEAAGEVARAISILTYYSQACFAAIGDLYPPSLAGLLFSQRRPHGVAGLITPWNFPLAIPLWKSAPALASGNAVVLKPAPAAPACARLIEDLLAPHLPDGAFSLVHGDADTGRALVNAADIISFTGSDRVGRAVSAQAGERAVPAQCEMGGQNAAIVFDDADPALAAKLVAGAAMGYAGQKCTATRRVIVVDNTEFVDALVAAVSAIPAQAPESPDTTVGPLISEDARAKVLRAVELARSAGGQVVAGGAAMPGEGWYVAPTLITGLAPDHPLAQQETFGPIATIHNARDAEEAVRIANGVRFGLVTSLHGRDLDRLLQSANAIDTGLIKVNAPTTGVDFYAPFGGEKDSSYGPREQGLDALAFYSSTRTVTIAPHGAGG
jgi:acyl-CoA reductase-like NAD-dependent aldehyde dehydrogenase